MRNVEDFEMWLTDVEAQLASEDYGRDLSTVQALEKKQHLLEADYVAHQDRVDQFKAQANKFNETGTHYILHSPLITHHHHSYSYCYRLITHIVIDLPTHIVIYFVISLLYSPFARRISIVYCHICY